MGRFIVGVIIGYSAAKYVTDRYTVEKTCGKGTFSIKVTKKEKATD